MNIKKYYFIILVIIFYSCDFDIGSRNIKEGIIEYDITYFEDEKDNPIISLLPNSMTLKFKDNNTVSEIVGWMGIFSSCLIMNNKDSISSTMLKIMNKKYFCQTHFNEPSIYSASYEGMKIVFVDETKEIAGYKCKKAIVSFPDTSKSTFEIYYTDEIKIDDLYLGSPYKSINGVLIEFQMELNNICMKLTLNNITNDEVSDDEFLIPDDYERVATDSLEKIFHNLIL